MSDEFEEITFPEVEPEPEEKPIPKKQISEPRKPVKEIDEVTVRNYPKTILFYPTMAMSIVLAIIQFFLETNPLLAPVLPQLKAALGFIWFIFFAFNLFVITFEFSKGVVVALFLIIIIIIMTVVLFIGATGIPIAINPALLNLQLSINSLLAFFALFAIITLSSWLSTRFYYFRITPNEIIYKKGILGDVERYSTTSVTVHKEIRDLFEYMLFRSGRLTITVPGRKTAILIENVPKINSIEEKMLNLLRRIEIDID